MKVSTRMLLQLVSIDLHITYTIFVMCCIVQSMVALCSQHKTKKVFSHASTKYVLGQFHTLA